MDEKQLKKLELLAGLELDSAERARLASDLHAMTKFCGQLPEPKAGVNTVTEEEFLSSPHGCPPRPLDRGLVFANARDADGQRFVMPIAIPERKTP